MEFNTRGGKSLRVFCVFRERLPGEGRAPKHGSWRRSFFLRKQFPPTLSLSTKLFRQNCGFGISAPLKSRNTCRKPEWDGWDRWDLCRAERPGSGKFFLQNEPSCTLDLSTGSFQPKARNLRPARPAREQQNAQIQEYSHNYNTTKRPFSSIGSVILQVNVVHR